MAVPADVKVWLEGLQTRHDQPATSPPGVDQLLGGQARTRPQVGEAALDGAPSDAHELGRVRNGSAGGDVGGENVHLALRRLGREGAAQVPVPQLAAGHRDQWSDAHTYGFTLQEQAWPFPSEMAPEIAVAVADDLPADAYPNVATMLGFVATTRPGSLVDFEFGLDVLLDGLEQRLETG